MAAEEQATDLTLESAPIDELVLGVQLQAGVAEDAVTLADFWPRVRNDFPSLEKHPPLPPGQEDFGNDVATGLQFELLTAAPPPRYWFVSQDDSRLVQVQPDRFFLNWRKRSEAQAYPRYRVLREDFERRFGELLLALPAQARDGAAATWCEVSYINHVDAEGPGDERHRPLSDILRLIASPTQEVLPPPEDTQFHQRYVLRNGDGPIGRLYISATPALRAADRRPIYVLTLLARLRPETPDLQGVVGALDRAHDVILPAFRNITTPAMHRVWGLIEDSKS